MTPFETTALEMRDEAVAAPDPPAESIRLEKRIDAPNDTRAEAPSLSPPAEAVSLESAYEEFRRCIEEGEAIDAEAFCNRFPTFGSVLRQMIAIDRGLGETPQLIRSTRREKEAIAWPTAGQTRGDLTILEELGQGSFARVYLASEASTGDRRVVVKFSVNGDLEARTMGRLSHPHIVPILSAQREESTGLIAVRMPYLGCATLENVLERAWPIPNALPPRQADVIVDAIRACARPEDPPIGAISPRLKEGTYVDGVIHLAVQLAETLAFLHERGVSHRDLKPSNVLLDPSGKPLLLDFNLAISDREVPPSGGTLWYMAPEQLRSFLKYKSKRVDQRADLFALGTIVHELLTGDHPVGPLPRRLKGRPLARSLLKRLGLGIRPERRAMPDLERPVAAVLERCLAVDPAERPSAAELAVELKRQFTPVRRVRRWSRAHRRATLFALASIALAAAAVGYAWTVTPPFTEREYRRGETAYRAGDYDEAEKHFDRAMQADPDNPRLRFARGCARLKRSKTLPSDSDKLDQAWADLKPADDGGMDASTLAVKAYIESRRQNAASAIGMYDQLDRAGYRPLMVLNNRAYDRIVRRHFAEARKDLDRAAQLDPHCQAVFYNRAMLTLYERFKNTNALIPPLAVDDMERALELGPTTAVLYRDAALLVAIAAYDDLRCAPVVLDAPISTALHLRTRARRIECAWVYLRQAVLNGESLERIERNHSFQVSLNVKSHIASLRQLQPERTTASLELRLVDPIDLPD